MPENCRNIRKRERKIVRKGGNREKKLRESIGIMKCTVRKWIDISGLPHQRMPKEKNQRFLPQKTHDLRSLITCSVYQLHFTCDNNNFRSVFQFFLANRCNKCLNFAQLYPKGKASLRFMQQCLTICHRKLIPPFIFYHQQWQN